MMNRAEISIKIGTVLQTVLGHGDFLLTDSLNAASVAGWDSLSHMIIIADIETAFGIRFRLRELSKMENLGELIDLIESKIQA